MLLRIVFYTNDTFEVIAEAKSAFEIVYMLDNNDDVKQWMIEGLSLQGLPWYHVNNWKKLKPSYKDWEY